MFKQNYNEDEKYNKKLLNNKYSLEQHNEIMMNR